MDLIGEDGFMNNGRYILINLLKKEISDDLIRLLSGANTKGRFLLPF